MEQETLTLKDVQEALLAEIQEGRKTQTEAIEALGKRVDEIEEARKKESEKDPASRLKSSVTSELANYGDPEVAKLWSWERAMKGVASNWTGEAKHYPERHWGQECFERNAEALSGYREHLSEVRGEEPGTRTFTGGDGESTITVKVGQQSGPDSAGGFMVPPVVFVDQVIPALEADSVLLEAGATVQDGLTGSPADWPKVTGLPDGFWVGEVEDATDTEATFGQLELNPHGLAAIVPISNRNLRQTGGRMETVIRGLLIRALRRRIDLAGFKGTGGKQPTGVFNLSGINQVDKDDYTFALGATQQVTMFLEDMIGSLEDNDALDGRLTWFMHPYTKRWLRFFTDADGRPLLFGLQNSGAQGKADRLFYEYPYRTSTQLTGGASETDADLLFGDVSRMIAAFWLTLTLSASREAEGAFRARQTLILAETEMDWGVMHEEAFCEALDLNTSALPT